MFNRLLLLGTSCIVAVVLLVSLLIFSKVVSDGSGSNLSVLKVFAGQVQEDLDPKTVICEENIYLCGDVEEVARKTTGSLRITSEKDLRQKYSALGYTLIFKDKNVLAQRKVNEFCSYHRVFRHLGVHENKLAVFQGPIGYDQKLLRVEETIPLQTLSADYQVKLQQGMEFFQMTPETQAKLRYELEFTNEDALNAILENLDELQD